MKTPPGHRFLIQLVDAPTAADAAQEVRKMFGTEAYRVCVVEPGSEVASNSPHSVMTYTPQKSGFTIFVPEGFRI